MNDKELLELAAKAAGIEFANQSDEDVQLNQFVNNKHLLKNSEYWNPLTDDGDALRLAVRLDLNIRFSRKHIDVSMDAHGLGDICETFTTFKEAATRRAIVRAAAEIGKTK
jgi:hypothetical protein